MAWSADGGIFDPPSIFQDSAGVPSAIRWKGDTLICAFQWFRQPMGSATWDRVAVKFSYDAGMHWTDPEPISIAGLPPGYQRPFDPTLTAITGDSIRVYFSSSRATLPGSDSLINTYSALSADGVHYAFEPSPRVDHPTKRVIDPAVIFFNSIWHYSSPVGAPQEGAHHYVSADGLVFSSQGVYPSDNTHAWTGNYLVQSSTELRFYGSGPQIWYNTSPDGFTWTGYVHTNVQGGDPTAIRLSATRYAMIFVGQPYQTGIVPGDNEHPVPFGLMQNYPNPFNSRTSIRFTLQNTEFVLLTVYDLLGREIAVLVKEKKEPGSYDISFNGGNLASGVYYYRLQAGERVQTRQLLLVR